MPTGNASRRWTRLEGRPMSKTVGVLCIEPDRPMTTPPYIQLIMCTPPVADPDRPMDYPPYLELFMCTPPPPLLTRTAQWTFPND
jgi:hypothetical protein